MQLSKTILTISINCFFSVQLDTKFTFTVAAPPPPRVIDPANICNNLYETGFGKQGRRDEPEDYWDVFAERIDTLDLSIPFEKLNPLIFRK